MLGKRLFAGAVVAAAAAVLTMTAGQAVLASAAQAAAGPTASAATIEGVPHFDHVFTIILENENLAATWHTPNTYLHSLLAKGTFATQYYGASHVSADNYIAMTSGQMPTPLFQSDCLVWDLCFLWQTLRPDGGVSVTDQIDAAGKTWRGYMDEMGTPCLHGPAGLTPDPYQVGYATRHDPFVYYPPIVNGAHGYCNNHVVDYTHLASDISSLATTPNYVFITPDTCHDGHDAPCSGADHNGPGGAQGGLVSANLWMKAEVPKILGSPAFTTPGVSSLLLITTDEAATTDLTGCVTGPLLNGGMPGLCASGVPPIGIDGGGLIGLLAIGAHVAAGHTTAVPSDHASMLRTVEDALALGPLHRSGIVFQDAAGHLNEAGSPLEHAMSTLFSG